MEVGCEQFRLPELPENSNFFGAFSDIIVGSTTIYSCVKHLANASNRSVMEQFVNMSILGAKEIFWLNEREIFSLTILCSLWLIARFFVVKGMLLFSTKYWTGLSDGLKEKISESTWKVISYFFLWICSVVVVFFRGHDFFYNTSLMFTADRNFHFDLSLCYALEASFYVHAFISMIFFEAKKKDDIAMILHHFVTLFLIGFSYKINALTVGMIIFVLDDINDILLEFGKLCNYITYTDQYRGSKLLTCMAYTSIGGFVILWITNRLYFHITKVWRAGAYGFFCSYPRLPVNLFPCAELFFGLLYIFYWYWFIFIVRFVYRLIFTNQKKDPREKDD